MTIRYRIIVDMFVKIRHSIGFIVIIVAISMLIWGEWKFPREIKNFPINFPEIQFNENKIYGSLNSEIDWSQVHVQTQLGMGEKPENTSDSSIYRLIIDSPSKVRVGDSDTIRLELISEIPEVDIRTTASPNEAAQSSTVTDSPIFSTYHIMIETRLDLEGTLSKPAGDVITPFQPGQTLRLYWTIEPERKGIFRGMLWLHSQYVSRDGNISRKLLSAQQLELSAVSFCGLSSDYARLLGSLGFFTGLALVLDLILCFITKTNTHKGKSFYA